MTVKVQSKPGRVETHRVFICGRCGRRMPTCETNEVAAKREARRRGWRVGLWLGWTCPECLGFLRSRKR